MKNFKRILALVLTFTFVLSMAIVGVSASYQGKWYAAAVDYLDSISISDIGAFGDEPLSRDEFVTWVAKIESHQTIESAWKDIEFVALNTFSDVDSSNHKGAISYSVGREFIEGNGDGTFTPHNTVTFAEACAVIVRLMDYTDLVQGNTWEEKVHWYQHIANAYCGAIDDVFLRESETYDPEYKLSKGEGAYLLYSIMNGAYWTGVDEDASINRTSYGVDLGEYFGTAPFAKVSAQYVVVSAPLKYTNTTQVFRRYDAYVTGATYDALYDDSHLYPSTGALDTASDKPVVLVNTFTGEYLNVDPAVFSKLALAADAEAADALEVVEVGGVVTLTFIRRVFDAATAQNYLDTTDYVTLTVNEALAADTYVGRDKAKPDNSIEGWRKAATDVASNSNNAARLTDAVVYWNGDTLVVNGDEYTIVDEYTGAAYELKVFAPAEVASTTTKSLISVVGYTGDKVYAGATFSDGQKAILLAHGDYASKFNGNTVTETFTLTSDIPSFVAYELEVEGAFVTATSFGVVSNIIGSDGRIDDNVIDTTTALTVAEAKSLILEPAQGESNVVFSDTDRDGIYDIAVVTESSRALYYTGINNSSYDLGNEFIGGNDTNWEKSANRTREIYDAFGNYVLSVTTLKGNGIGGLVVDQTVSTGGATFAGGTDNWKLVDTATDKVQLVVTVSNERQSYGGNNDTQLYGVSGAHPYKVVDVADLTTGYVFTGSNETVTIDGTAYYRYIIQNADETFSIVYVPATPTDQVDVDVTLDGVTSTVTFNAGKDLLAAAVAAPGSALVGHTVKYVADENGVVWCIKDVAKKSAVTGFVTGSGTTKTAGVYNVTLVTTGHSGKSEIEYTDATTAALVAERIGYGYTSALFTNSFGIDALFAEEGEMTVKVWRFTEAGEAYLLAAGAKQATTTYDFETEDEAYDFIETYGLYLAAKVTVVETEDEETGDMIITYRVTVQRNNFNGLFCHGVSGNAPLTGLYYAAVDGETMPMIKATGYVNGAFGSLFVAGTLFSYSDGRYYVKDEFRDYYDVTSYVTENNFDALTEIATLYVLVDGDYVEADDYDAEAVYYALFFEEVEYDAYDLFGYIDWTKFGDTVEVDDTTSIKALEAAAVDYYTGKGVNTYEVKASLTSVWGSSASATDLLTAILDGKLYNADNLAEDDTFTSNDLLYVSLTLDGSGYYALEGVDTASYGRTVVSTGFNHTASGAWTMVNIGNDTTNTFIRNLTYNGVSNGYRSRIRLAYSFDIVAAGAATTWVAGGEDWENSYILKYEKVADTQELLPVNAAGQVPGEKNEYKMTIGYNPYFVKSVDSNGKVTFKLQWTELAEYEGIIGTTTYKFDPNKAVLIPLYVDSGKTQLVNGSELAAKDYTTDNDYFVDEEGKVWKIDSAEAAYDHDLSKGTTIYDDTNKVATGATATAPTSYNTLKTVEVTKSGDTYKLNINMGLGSADKVVTIDGDKEIVIVTPTNTKVVTITVTTAAKLYEAGQTIFATEYQLNGTTLSVIGTTSGDASKINIPTVSETPTEDPDNPDDPTAEVKTCYITPEGLALDITTGEVFTAVKNAPAAGYYNVSKSGAVKGEAELLDGVVTAISPLGKATGIDGEVVFIQDGTVSDKQPWGVAYSYLYVELYVSSILSQQVPEVTFSYIVVNGVNYVLVDTIAHN